MARTWKEVRAEAADRGLINEERVTTERQRIREAVQAQRLADIRKAQGETQTSLAGTMHVTQPRVSKIERGDLTHTELGTLESYVAALGGKLEIVAHFGGQTIKVK